MVQEVERYRLDIVELASTHSSGSGKNSLRGVGPSTMLALSKVKAAGQVWTF